MTRRLPDRRETLDALPQDRRYLRLCGNQVSISSLVGGAKLCERTFARLEDLSLPCQGLYVPQQQHTGRAAGRALKFRSKDTLRLRVGLADDVEAVDLGKERGTSDQR